MFIIVYFSDGRMYLDEMEVEYRDVKVMDLYFLLKEGLAGVEIVDPEGFYDKFGDDGVIKLVDEGYFVF